MEQAKICVDCKTSKTPLWRSGPAGPKSLCNACGIRFRKKKLRIKLMAIGKEVLLMKKVKRRKVQNREFGEVEQAAFLLMALSCGSVFG